MLVDELHDNSSNGTLPIVHTKIETLMTGIQGFNYPILGKMLL